MKTRAKFMMMILEEMDLKWNMLFLSMRARKFYQRTRRKNNSSDGNSNADMTNSKEECFNFVTVSSSDVPTLKDGCQMREELSLPKIRKEITYATKEASVNNDKPSRRTVRARGFNAVKPSACWVWRPIKPNGASLSNSQLNEKGFVDSGCSRHMSGNIAHLSDFKEFDGGYVTFGGGANDEETLDKGTIKTNTLIFEDVYFC
ncbi:hypothetical protein Tco_1146819 [Tanacetum coccineum]